MNIRGNLIENNFKFKFYYHRHCYNALTIVLQLLTAYFELHHVIIVLIEYIYLLTIFLSLIRNLGSGPSPHCII